MASSWLQQAHGFEQQVVEIQRVGRAQRLFVFLEHLGQRLGFLVDGALVEVLRRLLPVLGVADPGERRAVLHELLFVQAETAVGGLDDAELIFVVVDGEAPRETGANARQRIAIAPQQPHAERVEGGDVGRGIEIRVFEQRGDALPHFVGGFVGERDRQNGGRRHAPRGDDMRDAVGDDAGLAAARAGQNQKRPFRMHHRFALLRVQPFEKIHEMRTDSSLTCGVWRASICDVAAAWVFASKLGRSHALIAGGRNWDMDAMRAARLSGLAA